MFVKLEDIHVAVSGVARIFQQGVRNWGHGRSRGTGISTNKLLKGEV
jgi:hypothetical protein